jgi:hypothetical protein
VPGRPCKWGAGKKPCEGPELPQSAPPKPPGGGAFQAFVRQADYAGQSPTHARRGEDPSPLYVHGLATGLPCPPAGWLGSAPCFRPPPTHPPAGKLRTLAWLLACPPFAGPPGFPPPRPRYHLDATSPDFP